MPSPNDLTTGQREELLRRSWMASDGIWFYATATAHGLDHANAVNREVVREFACQEMRRLMRALGVDTPRTPSEYLDLFSAAMDLYLGSLFKAEESFVGGAHHLVVTTCFAYLGVVRAGIEREYHCGPGERLTGWLDAMGLTAQISPEVGHCHMAYQGSCAYRIAIDLPDPEKS